MQRIINLPATIDIIILPATDWDLIQNLLLCVVHGGIENIPQHYSLSKLLPEQSPLSQIV